MVFWFLKNEKLQNLIKTELNAIILVSVLFHSSHLATTEVFDAVSIVSLFYFVPGPIADLSVDSRVFFSVGIDCWRIDRVAICFRCSPDCLLTAISRILPPNFKSGRFWEGEFIE